MEHLLGRIPAGSNRIRLGTVVTVDGVRMVNVDGNNLLATWADPMVVDDGDPVEVNIFSAGRTAKAHVARRSTAQPRPRSGVVKIVPAGSLTITVEAAGVPYQAEPIGGPYSVGDRVHLDWGAGTARVVGKVGSAAVVRPAVVASPIPPPPPPPSTGKTSSAARCPRTFGGRGGWGSYAGDGNKVHQGSWSGATVTGAWFYGAPFKALAGREITRIQFRTGQRLAIGYNNQPATFHFHAHTHSSQPGGDTNRVVGPFNWTARPGQAPTWIDLPLSFAQTLVNGGGIAITGDPYAGMSGATSSSPDSGSLILHWRK